MNQMAGSQLTPAASTTESDMLFSTRDETPSRSLVSVSLSLLLHAVVQLLPSLPTTTTTTTGGIIPTTNPPTLDVVAALAP